jgi:hypothetical protein
MFSALEICKEKSKNLSPLDAYGIDYHAKRPNHHRMFTISDSFIGDGADCNHLAISVHQPGPGSAPSRLRPV